MFKRKRSSNILEQNLTITIDNHVPKIKKKRMRGRRCQWLSTEIKKVIDERDRI